MGRSLAAYKHFLGELINTLKHAKGLKLMVEIKMTVTDFTVILYLFITQKTRVNQVTTEFRSPFKKKCFSLDITYHSREK